MKKLFAMALFIALAISINAQTDKRIALVIGNSHYTSGENSLKNPVNDANLMASTLQSLGFTVIKRTDVNRQQMSTAITEFWNKLGEYNVALFYYAGHGAAMNGVNYILPTDAQLNDIASVELDAISISSVVAKFDKYPNNTNILILDACRNNPFKSKRGNDRGFKAINPTKGTLIAFAASDGEFANDNPTGNNGLFTAKLVEQMKQPIMIEQVFKKTRTKVQAASNNEQNPMEWNMLNDDFYFIKPNANATISIMNPINTQPDEGGLETGTVVYAYGSIIINTEIAGTLYVDGKAKGSLVANSQNNKLNKQLAGTHAIEIRGDETYTETITVEKDQTSIVNVKSTKKKAVVSNSGSFNFNADFTSNIPGVSGGMGVAMRSIRGGSFTMGSEDGSDDEKPAHTVAVGNFAMMKYEVTFDEYDKYCDATNSTKPYDQGWGRGTRPVINVSWDDATAYAKWLSQKTGQTWRLPTEAEWEYAAKGGIENKYAGSDNVGDVAWFRDNSSRQTQPVGQKKPNAYGLYDMSGNVWEWCSDWYKGYQGSYGVSDYTGSRRVLRGGGWFYEAANCRVSLRSYSTSGGRNYSYGFRLVLGF